MSAVAMIELRLFGIATAFSVQQTISRFIRVFPRMGRVMSVDQAIALMSP